MTSLTLPAAPSWQVGPIKYRRSERRAKIQESLASFVGDDRSTAFLAGLNAAAPTDEVVVEGITSALRSPTMQKIAAHLQVDISGISTCKVTTSFGDIIKYLYGKVEDTEVSVTAALVDQEIRVIGKLAVTSNWPPLNEGLVSQKRKMATTLAGQEPTSLLEMRGATLGNEPSPTTSFLRLSGLKSDIASILQFFDLQPVAFLSKLSGKRPLQAMGEEFYNIYLFLECLRRFVTSNLVDNGIELCLCSESQKDIEKATDLLNRFNVDFKRYNGTLVSEAVLISYTVYVNGPRMQTVLHGLAPCAMSWYHTSAESRKHQDVAIACFRSVLPDGVLEAPDAAQINAARDTPILFRNKVGVKLPAIPEWRAAAWALYASSPIMSNQELVIKDAALASKLRAYLASEQAVEDVATMEIPSGGDLAMTVALLQGRYNRTLQDKKDVIKLDRSVEQAPSQMDAGIDRLAARLYDQTAEGTTLEKARRVADATSAANGSYLRQLYERNQHEFENLKYPKLSDGARYALIVYQQQSPTLIDPKIEGQRLLSAVVVDGKRRVFLKNASNSRDAEYQREEDRKYREKQRAITTNICRAPVVNVLQSTGKRHDKVEMDKHETCGRTGNTRWYYDTVKGGPVCEVCYQKYSRYIKKQHFTEKALLDRLASQA